MASDSLCRAQESHGPEKSLEQKFSFSTLSVRIFYFSFSLPTSLTFSVFFNTNQEIVHSFLIISIVPMK